MTDADFQEKITRLIDRWCSLNVSTRDAMADEIITVVQLVIDNLTARAECAEGRLEVYRSQVIQDCIEKAQTIKLRERNELA